MSNEYTISDESELTEVLGEAPEFVQQKVTSQLDEAMIEFVRRSPLIFYSTIDERGQADVSPKGDAPGFVQVEDGQLLIPDRPGNRLAFGFRNLLRNPQIGLIFVVPNMRETLRVKGRAEITRDPACLEALSAQGKPALLCTRVSIDECFFHCGKAMIRSSLWQPEAWAEQKESLMIRQFARKMGGDDQLESIIEAEIEKNYQEELY